MARKVSLPPVNAGRRRKAADGQMNVRGRRVNCEVLTPAGAPPIIRLRIATPLTPRSIRMRMIEAHPQSGKSVRRKLTPLDRLLDEGEAEALELWAHIENEAGRVKSADWSGVKVDQSSKERIPFITKEKNRTLRLHAAAKKVLTTLEKEALAIFSAQMLGDKTQSKERDLALHFRLCGAGDKAAASKWRRYLQSIARKLAIQYRVA